MPNLFLIGPMGAGKTTIGRQLARNLGRNFYDSDKVIEERTGVSIPLIFELEQEQGFRKREKAIIDELTQYNDIVLATGGGAVLDAENRQHLASRGHVIYLHAPIEYLVQRTSKDNSRPLLQTEDPKRKLQELMEIRDPLYRETAHTVIETDSCPVKRVVAKLLNMIKEQNL
ncbi:MAG: shikimate kinase AroK [Gammaproteobacteria bacterium]|jgi:shikimate kinase|nr:shikimate kinase AroK [Gammaproteobacteria bacterium]